MSKKHRLTNTRHRRTIEALHKALDQTYQQLRDGAKADWARLFPSQDQSDESAQVHISPAEIAEELAGIPRAGFTRVRTKRINGKVRHHLA